MSLVDRHADFLAALRRAGLPVSVAEGIDASDAVAAVPWEERERVRSAYAATLVKRQGHRALFDEVFDLYFPPRVGEGAAAETSEEPPGRPRDTGPELTGFRDRLAEAFESGREAELRELAVEAVGRFGAMLGRGAGLSSYSAYQALKRVGPEELVEQLVAGLAAPPDDGARAELGSGGRGRALTARADAFSRMVEQDARRRVAEEKGPEHVARNTLRPTIDRLDFLSARRADLDQLRREIQPLARRLATRLTRERHARRRGPLDVRRTVRASIGTGGVPLTTHHRPKRPHRTELVVLCDVSGSVANFAQFTLLLVFALREQFSKVRAFTFVDDIHEVTAHFRPGADVVEVMTTLAAESAHAARFGRTNYGRAFIRFLEEHPEALGPRTSLLVLGDARSNYSDLRLEVLAELVDRCRHAFWLNPEHARNWGTGDSAAPRYAELVPMVECRNLTQLGEFVHDLV